MFLADVETLVSFRILSLVSVTLREMEKGDQPAGFQARSQSLFLLTLSVLPSLVQLRIFRLAKWWPQFRLFLKIVWASLRALRNPLMLLVTAGFIFTLVGMQLFQRDYVSGVCRISDDCALPRWHMGDLFHTFMMITRTLRGQWIECLWDCMQVTGKLSGQSLCVSFFMTVMVVGYLLVSQHFSHSCQYHEIG